MKQMENEIKRMERKMRLMDRVFGSLIVAGLIVACVVCPLMLHLS